VIIRSRWPDTGRFRSAFQAQSWSHYWWRAFPSSNRWRAAVRELDEADRVVAHTMGGLRPKDADTVAARKGRAR
jgi:hypothetical protein